MCAVNIKNFISTEANKRKNVLLENTDGNNIT